MGHHCCVPDCTSNNRPSGNGGLTFHSFPVDPKERKQWILSVKRADYKKLTVNKHTKVCSKHFREEDFVQSQGSKRRMLKKGVVPSVFSWISENHGVKNSAKKTETSSNESGDVPVKERGKVQSKDSKSINGTKKSEEKVKLESSELNNVENLGKKINNKNIKKESDNTSEDISVPHSSYSSPNKSDDSEQGSVCDLSAANGSSPVSSTNGTSNRKPSTLNFQLGTRLEAKDLGNETWYPVKVVEVDWDEEEVLIHFEKWSQRYDEWVPMDSCRLRPSQNPPPQTDGKNSSKVFNIGDRVMAKWSDCRRYPAKVKTVLGNDRYEVLFFDGFTKNIKGIRMTKLEGETENTEKPKPEPPEKKEVVQPIIKPVIKNAITEEAIGTKEERRERKRKINVAELFHTKKRIKLDTGSLSPRSGESEKGKKIDKRKRRKEGQSHVNDNINNEGHVEDNETPKGKKRDISSESSKSTTKSDKKEGDKKEEEEEEDRWIPDGENGYIVESADGPRKTTVISDKKLPSGWSKHSIQRKHGNSAGKWDVFLVNPQGRRFRSRHELRQYFEENGERFKSEVFDFCLTGRRRRSRISDTTTPVVKKKRGPKPKLRIGPRGDGIDKQPHTSPQQQQTSPSPPSVPTQRRVKTLLPKIRQVPASQPEVDTTEKHVDPPSPPPPYTTTVASVPAIKIETEMLEGEVLVGGLKIQMDGNSYKCPKEACGKNFRKENLLQMHIKHYHPEYNKFMGSTPNVADLAYARTIGESIDDLMPKSRYSSGGSVGMSGTAYMEKMNRFENSRKNKSGMAVGPGIGKGGGSGGGDGSPVPEKKKMAFKEKLQNTLAMKKAAKGVVGDGEVRVPVDDTTGENKEPTSEERTNITDDQENASSSLNDSMATLSHREEKKEPQTTIKTLLPVIRSPSHTQDASSVERTKPKFPSVEEGEEYVEVIDVGTRQVQPAHTTTSHPSASQSFTTVTQGPNVTKSLRTIRRRRLSDFHFEPLHKRRKIAATKLEVTEDVDVVDDGGSPVDVVTTPAAGTLSSGKSTPTYRYSRKKTAIVHLEKLNVTTDSNGRVILSPSMKEKPESKLLENSAQTNIDQLRKEELINCTCGFMEEDGLMIQCDLCLCWQHGICNNIEKEDDVPEKYVCPICLNPYRQRKSKKYMHDQDWLKEGKLPSLSFRSKNETNILEREAVLKRSHDLTGSLLQIQKVLHSLRVKVNIAGKPDHPKLYLWAKSWEKDGESSSSTQQGTESQSQIVNETEFKQELDVSCSQSEEKTHIPADVLDHKDIVPDTDISEKAIQESVNSIKEQCMETIQDGGVPKSSDGDMQIRTHIDEPETGVRLPEVGKTETSIEQECFEETVITDAEITHPANMEDDMGHEFSQQNNPEVVSIPNVATEVECSSNVECTENNEIVPSESETSDTIGKRLESTAECKIEDSVCKIDDEKRSDSTQITQKLEVEESKMIEELKEITTGDTANVREATDSEITSAPEIVVNDSNSKLEEESKHISAEEKSLDTEEVSSQLENHGLLHQALTNGSHGTNSMNNGSLSNQIDASGHPMLQLPICQSELMRFASTMADNLRVTESRPPAAVALPVPEPPRAPQPEAPIDPVECRLLLLDHIDHFQQQIDTRLTMLEEQVAALESQDPDTATDEAHDHYPQTKQAVQMLLRDLLTMRRVAALN